MLRVHFEYFGRNMSDDIEAADAVMLAKNGFWISNGLTLTNGTDRVYFIPPSRIIAIERLR